MMTKEEQEIFYLDPKIIDWSYAIKCYIHGI